MVWEKVSFATMIFERNPEEAPEFENGLETVKMGNFVTWEKNGSDLVQNGFKNRF
jgi:hypothetical protein